MSFSKVYGAQTHLLKGRIIDIEVDLSKGLYAFNIVGLPDKAVEESRDRVGAAIKNCGFTSPKQKNQKVVVSLAPADLKKEGPSFDLPIALAYLLSTGEILFNPEGKIFLGELSLDGELRKVNGVLPLVEEAKRKGFKEIYLPKENVHEAALIPDICIFGIKTLEEIIQHLDIPPKSQGKEKGEIENPKLIPAERTKIILGDNPLAVDFSDIKGQEGAKRGLEIAAAGGHNVAMFGPPGTGKTMLAKAFSGLLPPLSFDEILETTSIYSVAGLLKEHLITSPPFRSPHHTSSHVSVVGGGTYPKPGEVTLAHKGVLFLDEFPEFERRVIECLRQPLEDKIVSISRMKGTALFPANFILIAAMNPCPCGNFGVKDKRCICTPSNLDRYARKISGPIIDRIDVWLEVGLIDHDKLSDEKNIGESTTSIRERVIAARKYAQERFRKYNLKIASNSELSAKEIMKIINLAPKAREILNTSAKKLDLSARSYHRVLKLARTIADLDKREYVEETHILEALQYRPKKLENE